jgi:hypothetical protein
LRKGKWSTEEDEILQKWVQAHGCKSWSKLAMIIKGRSSKQIRDRWINNLNPLRCESFAWTDDLDKVLLIKYLEFGSSWVAIAKQIPNTTENVVKNRFYSLLRSVANKTNKKDKRKPHVVKGKRNNYSLGYLLNYLPNLFEEKGIRFDSCDNTTVFDKTETAFETPKQDILNRFTDEQKNFLANFFESLGEKTTRNEGSCVKSAVIFNLQLAILSRIIHKLRLQVFHRFFDCFKTNTLS